MKYDYGTQWQNTLQIQCFYALTAATWKDKAETVISNYANFTVIESHQSSYFAITSLILLQGRDGTFGHSSKVIAFEYKKARFSPSTRVWWVEMWARNISNEIFQFVLYFLHISMARKTKKKQKNTRLPLISFRLTLHFIYAAADKADAYKFYRCFFLSLFCFFPFATKIWDNRSRERLNGFSWNFYQTIAGKM